MKKFMKVLTIAFVCFVIVMGTGAYIFFNNGGDGLDLGKSGSEDGPEGKEPVNVLILGVDTKDVKHSKGARTDTMMVASFNPKTKKVDIISIPRDTRVTIRGHKGKDKINHAHAYGGVELSMSAVEDLLGIPINYYVKIDYKALGKIVDDLNGVEIDVPMDMKYSDPYADPPLKIDLKKGKQKLNGDKAMQFVRFRKGYADQDLGRINAQHMFLTALADKLLSPQAVIKLPKILKTFSTYVETNMPTPTITSYAMKGVGVNLSEIHMVTIPGEPKQMGGIWYYVPDMEKIKPIVANLGTSSQGNTQTVNTNQTEPLEKTVKVEVLNGSGIGGLATEVADKLKQEGFEVINISTIKGMQYSQTHIYDRKDHMNHAKKIGKLLGVKDIEKDIHNDSKADITIIVGMDQKK